MTFDDYLRFEQKYFNPQWEERYKRDGYEVKRVGKKGHDCVISKDSLVLKIEEKTRLTYYPDFCVEIIQDMNTWRLGWLFYCDANYVAYAYANEEYKQYLGYRIDWPLFKDWYIKNESHDIGGFKISEKGWGKTVVRNIPWTHLVAENIASKWFEDIIELREIEIKDTEEESEYDEKAWQEVKDFIKEIDEDDEQIPLF